ncbi:MAG: hypothetical protein NVSMB6_13850 [Burkholderiaceae bacterium]
MCFGPPPPAAPVILDLRITQGATIDDAIAMVAHEGLVEARFPGIDPNDIRTGIWGKLKAGNTVLREHDRIEIYRKLIADPKEARHRRADKKAAAARR